MPTYNDGKRISCAINSVRKQTFQGWELIVIDDGSTDNTEEMITSIKDRRIKYHKIKHVGITRAINVGLKLCKNEYIARHDADDISMPDRLELQKKFLDDNVNVGIVGSWIWVMDGNPHLIKPPEIIPDKPLKDIAGCIAVAGSMFRKSAIKLIGGVDENYKYAQDYKMLIDIKRAGYDIGCVQKNYTNIRFVVIKYLVNISQNKTNAVTG